MASQRLTSQQLYRLLATRPGPELPDDKRVRQFSQVLASADQKLLSKLISEQYYVPGEIIFKEGETGDDMYVIRSGQAVALKGNFQTPTILGYRDAGEIIGEMSLLENKPRSASVVALEDLCALRIKRRDFEQLLSHHPVVGMSIMATLSARLRAADDARKTSLRSASQLMRMVSELHTEKQQLLELQEALHLAGQAISNTLGLAELLDLILEYLVRIAPYDRAAVLLQSGNELEIVAARGFPSKLQHLSQVHILIKEDDIFQELCRSHRPLAIPDVLERSDWQHVEGLLPARAWLGVPLLRFNQVIGMLSLTREVPVAYSDGEVTLAATFAGQAAIALENARLYDRITRFTQQLEGIFREPAEAVQAAYAQLEILSLLDTSTVPGDIFNILTTFLFYHNLSELPAAVEIVSGLPPYDSSVRRTLERLKGIGAEVAAYQAATSRYQQLAALARATDRLDDLSEYVTAKVGKSERIILEGIILQWRRLVSGAGGEVGAAEESEPVANPYVAGNPVTGNLFVGREDILHHLGELWNKEGQYPSIVLYGHRRMGKTSILHNLGTRFGAHRIIVDFNMQRVGLVANTGEMLYNLALALYDSLSVHQQEELGEPDEERFTNRNPYTTFDRFLKRLDRVRARQRFIITVDEFELIEQMIIEGKLESRLLDFWRGLIQTYDWYIMAFAGLHTLQEMTQDYWHPLFGSVKAIPVSFLSPEAAWRLIVQPTPDFALDFDPQAVKRIIDLTSGQPYLIQLIGHGLVARFNRQIFEEGLAREPRFTRADVEAIINTPEFYRDGNAYFTGIWRLVEQGAPGQHAILSTLTKGPAKTEELAAQIGLPLEQILTALRTLQRHDIVQRIGKAADNHPWRENSPLENTTSNRNPWGFTVELMRRWVAQRAGNWPLY